MTRRATAWLAAATLALALVPAVARAHGALRSSDPAAGARLATSPREIRLTFTETPERGLVSIELVGAGGPIPLGALAVHPDSAMVILAPIAGALAPGRYTVRWRIVGRDGHPVAGSFAFTVLASATPVAATEPTAHDSLAHLGVEAMVPAPGVDTLATAHRETDRDLMSARHVIARWLSFAAILLVIGAACFRGVVLGAIRREGSALDFAGWADRRAATLGIAAALLVIGTAAARAWLQVRTLHGDAVTGGRIVAMLTDTLWGWGWILQVTAGAAAGIGFALARAGREGAWRIAGIAVVALAVSPALSGHAAGSGRLIPLAVAADALHVLGASGWLGTLAALLIAGLPATRALDRSRRAPVVFATVSAFSSAALLFASLAALTGMLSAWLRLGTIPALWTSEYGRVLLIKLAVLSAVALTGAYNWRRVTPALRDDAGILRLRRSATAEVAIAALVLAVTAVLVATPPPGMR